MLVLTRKSGESIIIDDNIEICILESSDGSVKIGINAPSNIKVLRKEILAEVKEQNIESTKNLEMFMKQRKEKKK